MLKARVPASERIINPIAPGFVKLNFMIKKQHKSNMKIASPIKIKDMGLLNALK